MTSITQRGCGAFLWPLFPPCSHRLWNGVKVLDGPCSLKIKCADVFTGDSSSCPCLRVGRQHRSRNRTWSDCGLCVLRFSWLRSYRLCLAQWRAKGETAEQRCSGGVVVHHLQEAGILASQALHSRPRKDLWGKSAFTAFGYVSCCVWWRGMFRPFASHVTLLICLLYYDD